MLPGNTSLQDIRNRSTGILTVWSDIGCPWASLAIATLHRAAEDAGTAVLIDHRAFPLELFNRRATPKPIIEAEIVAIAGLCPELVWRQWTDSEAYPVTMLPAMAAVQAAKSDDVGGLAASTELDARLRDAFYRDGRCISIHAEILDIAASCATINVDTLDAALRSGAGIADVFAQWRVADGPAVQGSPHLFVADHAGIHNPGVNYHWTAPPARGGVPRFTSYDRSWTRDLLATLESTTLA